MSPQRVAGERVHRLRAAAVGDRQLAELVDLHLRGVSRGGVARLTDHGGKHEHHHRRNPHLAAAATSRASRHGLARRRPVRWQPPARRASSSRRQTNRTIACTKVHEHSRRHDHARHVRNHPARVGHDLQHRAALGLLCPSRPGTACRRRSAADCSSRSTRRGRRCARGPRTARRIRSSSPFRSRCSGRT